jgi:hypothetical protein
MKMRDCRRDAQTSGKKLIVSNTDKLGGGGAYERGDEKRLLSLQIQTRMRDCKRDAQTSEIYTTTREGAWTKKQKKLIVSNTDEGEMHRRMVGKRLIVSNTDEVGGGRYERVGSEQALAPVQEPHRIKYRLG